MGVCVCVGGGGVRELYASGSLSSSRGVCMRVQDAEEKRQRQQRLVEERLMLELSHCKQFHDPSMGGRNAPVARSDGSTLRVGWRLYEVQQSPLSPHSP